MVTDPLDFEIDVDVSPLMGAGLRNVLVSSELYERAMPRTGRGLDLQEQFDAELRESWLHAQWEAAMRARQDRRQALRAPLLRRLAVDGNSKGIYVCDISRDGLRASGRPRSGLIDVELKVPGIEFPVETRAEVVDFRDANVLPIMNLRFVNLRRTYADGIDAYVRKRLSL